MGRGGRRERRERVQIPRDPRITYGFVAGVLLLFMCLAGWVYQEARRSLVFGNPHRFNMIEVGAGGQVDFLSFDPVLRRVFVLPFPSNLSIRSRSVGEYRMGALYSLGSYGGGSGGEFTRRKVQGFMKVPIPGYLVTGVAETTASDLQRGLWNAFLQKKTNLSRLDSAVLLTRAYSYLWKVATVDDLVRAGVFEQRGADYLYHPERLQQYVGTRLFDWGVGSEGVTVAVVNDSGLNGLGNDVADFLTNIGLDVVAVRSGTLDATSTVVTISSHTREIDSILVIMKSLFGFTNVRIGSTDQYRAQIVVTVGTDAQDLF